MDMWIIQVIGGVAMLLNISSYQLKSGRQLALCRGVGDCIYIVHYLLLKAYSGLAPITICAVNGLIYSFRGKSWAEWKGWKWLLSAILIVASVLSWQVDFQPLPSICALISILANVLLTWTGSSRLMRLGRLLIAGPTWIVYALCAGSIPGLLAELVGMGSAAVGLCRYGWRNEKTVLENSDSPLGRKTGRAL